MTLLGSFGSLLAGVVGWAIANILWRPFQRVEELRRRAHEDLIFYANIGVGSPDSDLEAAHLALRKVGAALVAEAESAWRPIKIWTKWWGWDLLRAGQFLVQMANAIDITDMKINLRQGVFDALGLPPYAGFLGIAARRPPRAPPQ
jgi:hypothetical protein